MQIWVIYGILLVTECCGTLGTAVNEAYFALFSMGAHGTGMTPTGLLPFKGSFFIYDIFLFYLLKGMDLPNKIWAVS